MIISKVIENIIEKGARYLKVLRFGTKDTANAFLLNPFGEDCNIPNGYKSLFIKTSNKSEPICIGVINKNIIDSLDLGEKQVFSTNEAGDSISVYIKFANDGTMEINGNSDFVSGFNDLKTGFDQLRSDFNSFLTHVHGASGTPPVPPATPSTASIDDCKKDNIKIE